MQLTFDALDPTRSDAVFDASQRYRYGLWRCWDPGRPTVNFLMLNPSTADQYPLDPTVTRCLRYAQRWGYGSLIVTNRLSRSDRAGLSRDESPASVHRR